MVEIMTRIRKHLYKQSSRDHLIFGLLCLIIAFAAVGCKKSHSAENEDEHENADTSEIVSESNGSEEQQTTQELYPEAIFSMTDPIDAKVGLFTLVDIAAALDYWHAGNTPIMTVEYDNNDQVVKDTSGNRLQITPSQWIQTVRFVRYSVQKDEPSGYPIRGTGYERYDPETETLVQLQTSRSREVARYSYRVTVVIDEDMGVVTLKWITIRRLDG